MTSLVVATALFISVKNISISLLIFASFEFLLITSSKKTLVGIFPNFCLSIKLNIIFAFSSFIVSEFKEFKFLINSSISDILIESFVKLNLFIK